MKKPRWIIIQQFLTELTMCDDLELCNPCFTKIHDKNNKRQTLVGFCKIYTKLVWHI